MLSAKEEEEEDGGDGGGREGVHPFHSPSVLDYEAMGLSPFYRSCPLE